MQNFESVIQLFKKFVVFVWLTKASSRERLNRHAIVSSPVECLTRLLGETVDVAVVDILVICGQISIMSMWLLQHSKANA